MFARSAKTHSLSATGALAQFSRACAFAGLILVPLSSAFAQTSARIALARSVVLHSPIVRLLDLLPPGASEELQTRAMRVTLGASPLPGSHRTLTRAELLRALRKDVPLRSALDLPPAIDLSRWSRPLSNGEVLAAILDSFRRSRIAIPATLTAQDIVLSSPVEVADGFPSLNVTSVEESPDGSGTHVRISIASEPRIPPFWAKFRQRVDRLDSASENAATLAIAAPARGSSASAAASLEPAGLRSAKQLPATDSSAIPGIEARNGKPMRLVLVGRDMRITMVAVPLESGRPGETIRLRNPRTGKVFSGIVVSQSAVEVNF